MAPAHDDVWVGDSSSLPWDGVPRGAGGRGDTRGESDGLSEGRLSVAATELSWEQHEQMI